MTTRDAAVVAPTEAMIIPPPGGPAILKVVSTTYPNAVRQEISLATEARSVGENKITIVRFTDKGGDGNDARLRDIPFSQVNLTEEALAAWPATGMAVSPYYVQNDYGPFGYAIGRPPNGDACIYAWQRIEPARRPSGAGGRGAVTVRLQLCRAGARERELVEVMYRLRLNTSLFPPQAAPPAIGRRGAPIRPVGADGFAQVIEIEEPAPPRRTTTAPRTEPVIIPAAIASPPPGAPIVPSPSGTGSSASGPIVPRPPASSVVVPSPPTEAR